MSQLEQQTCYLYWTGCSLSSAATWLCIVPILQVDSGWSDALWTRLIPCCCCTDGHLCPCSCTLQSVCSLMQIFPLFFSEILPVPLALSDMLSSTLCEDTALPHAYELKPPGVVQVKHACSCPVWRLTSNLRYGSLPTQSCTLRA